MICVRLICSSLSGYGPYHSTVVRPEQKRLDFSRPRTIAGRPVSELDERAGSQSEAAELAPGDTIRLFTSTQRKIQEAAVHARSYRTTAPNYVQAESNQPLSSHSHVSLERFQAHDGGSGVLESAMQPQISASFIQKQTALRLASKAQQLEQYHHNVQERLRRKLLEQKREEERRRAQLPSKVKKLVYDMHTPGCETPVTEQAGAPLGEEQQQQQYASSESVVDHGLARMDMLPYHESAAPPAAVVQAWSQPSQVRSHPESFGSASQRAHGDGGLHSSRESQRSLVSKQESIALMLLVRKQEMEKSRQQAQQARLNPSASSGQLSSRSGRSRERVAFGSALSRTPSPSAQSPPRPTPRGLICRAEERDDLHRNPRSFVVRQHTAEQEEPEADGAVLHVGLAAAAAVDKKARMSAAVAGRRLPKKKKAPRGDGGAGALEKNAAYRRLLLERLHAMAQTLQHPLPPLCACGFTAKEEYELLFSFQGAVPNAPIAPSQPPPGHLPFNLSTIISQQQQQQQSASSSSLRAASQQPQLPAHVSVDSTRHAFQHKHNCNFYNNPDAYIKALANLLHTLEDQQQI